MVSFHILLSVSIPKGTIFIYSGYSRHLTVSTETADVHPLWKFYQHRRPRAEGQLRASASLSHSLWKKNLDKLEIIFLSTDTLVFTGESSLQKEVNLTVQQVEFKTAESDPVSFRYLNLPPRLRTPSQTSKQKKKETIIYSPFTKTILIYVRVSVQ